MVLRALDPSARGSRGRRRTLYRSCRPAVMEGHARVSIASGSAIGRWESRDQRHPFSTARERTSTALYGPSAPAASVRAASIYARRPMHVGQKVCASMNAHTRSIASKTIPPRLCMAMVLSALVWLGGPRSAGRCGSRRLDPHRATERNDPRSGHRPSKPSHPLRCRLARQRLSQQRRYGCLQEHRRRRHLGRHRPDDPY